MRYKPKRKASDVNYHLSKKNGECLLQRFEFHEFERDVKILMTLGVWLKDSELHDLLTVHALLKANTDVKITLKPYLVAEVDLMIRKMIMQGHWPEEATAQAL